MHLTNAQKIYRLKNGAVVGTAGDSDDRDVRALLEKATPRRMPSRKDLAETKTTFEGIMVFPKGQVFSVNVWREKDEWRGAVDPISDTIIATGHGWQFAYGAMEAGASPIDAVRITCRRDITCALPVQYEKI